ncbi:MAG: Trm112 family protein [Desulfurococcaceae archaeon]
MRYWGLDIVRCVHCKNFPLEIIVIESEKQNIDVSGIQTPLCKSYCGYLKENVQSSKEYPCLDCLKTGIKTAVLYCPECKRWYPVRDGIVHLLTDNRRKKERDLEFLRKYKDHIPKYILEEGKPFNLLKID